MIEANRLRKTIEIPEGVKVEKEGRKLAVSKGSNTVKKPLYFPTIELKIEENQIVLEPKRFTKREKKMINTFTAHIKNMIQGVQEPFEYRVKICSSHFPMSVAVKGDKISIKNFLGEKIPREAVVRSNTTAKVEGDEIVIVSPDRESAGQTAANCEQATRITNRDRRIFQDGIWISSKAGKEL